MPTTEFTPPYSRSWVDRLLDGIDRLPVPAWVFFSAFFAISWIIGIWYYAPNYPTIPGQLFTSIAGCILVGAYWLRSTATSAVHTMRPALDMDDVESETLAYRLAVTPPRVAWLVLAWEVIYLPLYVMSDAEPFGYRELPLPALVAGLVVWMIGEGIGNILIIMTVRRLVIIGRIRRDLANVELFRQQPLHSFSKLTFRSAGVMLFLFAYIPLLSLGTEAFHDPFYLWSLVAGGIGAVFVAVVPLVGTHNAIADEKRRRSMANGDRIEVAVTRLQEAVDAGDSSSVDARQKSVSALITERDLIAKAATWPWAPGTIRTLATTLLLPLFLLIASRIADRVFG